MRRSRKRRRRKRRRKRRRRKRRRKGRRKRTKGRQGLSVSDESGKGRRDEQRKTKGSLNNSLSSIEKQRFKIHAMNRYNRRVNSREQNHGFSHVHRHSYGWLNSTKRSTGKGSPHARRVILGVK